MGDPAFVQQLLDWGADPCLCDANGLDAWHLAAHLGNVDGLKALMRHPSYSQDHFDSILMGAFAGWIKTRVTLCKTDKIVLPLINQIYRETFIFLTSIATTSPSAGATLIEMLACLRTAPNFPQEQKDFFPEHIGEMLRDVLSEIRKNNPALAKQIVNSCGRNSSCFASLAFAVFENHAEFIPCLLLAGADVMDSTLISPLFIAAQKGDILSMEALVKNLNKDQKSTLFSRTDKDGITPLHTAAAHGHLATVEWLLKAGARPLTISGSVESPLTGSITGGKLSQFPLNRTIEVAFGLPVSPVCYLDEKSEATKNRLRIIARLVDFGAKWTGDELLSLVASDIPPRLFKNLKIPQEAWRQALKTQGTTALLFALAMGRDDIVEYLLTMGMDFAMVGNPYCQGDLRLSDLFTYIAINAPHLFNYIPEQFIPRLFMQPGESGLSPLLHLALFAEGHQFLASLQGRRVIELCAEINPELTHLNAVILDSSGEYSQMGETSASDENIELLADCSELNADIESSRLSTSATQVTTDDENQQELTSPKQQRKQFIAISNKLEQAEARWREAADNSSADWREIEAAFSRLIRSVESSIDDAKDLPQFSTCQLKAKNIAARALYKMARTNPLSKKLGMGHAYVTAHGPEVQYRALRARIKMQGLSNASRFSGAQPLATAWARAEIAEWLLTAGTLAPGRYQGTLRVESLDGEGTDAQGTRWTSDVVCGVVDIAEDGTPTLVTFYPLREETVRGKVATNFAPHIVEFFKGLGK